LLIAAAAFMSGCTGVDDTLGQGMIPQHQRMELALGEVMSPFDSYIALNDSVPASGQGVLFLGNREDAVFGGMKASAMVDFYPVGTAWNDGEYFGTNPRVDSVYLELEVRRIMGKGNVAQKFNIYAMRDSVERNKVYEQGVRVSEKADLAAPLFSFELSDGIPEGSVARFKLDIEPAGVSYLDRLTGAPKELYETPWPEFNKEFYGFYIAPADPSLTDAAVFEIGLEGTAGAFYVFFHEAGTQLPEDELTPFATFDFRTIGWNASGRAVNIYVNQTEYTYPAAIADNLVDTDPELPPIGERPGLEPQSIAYVQCPGGVVTCLRATDELLAWFDAAKGDFSNMVLHKVQLTVPLLGDGQPKELMPPRLGMYYYYGRGVALPDYDFVAESDKVKIPYGGYLFRTGGYYRMDITRWATQLMLDPANTPREIWLGVDVDSRAARYSQAAFDAEQIKLDIIYTLIR
jgi:hypothetical protein